MNLILTILIAAFVVFIVVGIAALAWGIAHAPEGHEDAAGFHFDSTPAFEKPKPRAAKAVARKNDHPLGAIEPALF